MFRFSLLTLLGAVLVVSIGFAALRGASEVWARIVVTGTIVALLTATLGAIYLPTASRAFCGGFALLGWAYMFLVFGPWLEAIKPQLATTLALNRLQAAMAIEEVPQTSQTIATSMVWQVNTGNLITVPGFNNGIYFTGGGAPVPAALSFHQIGQTLWAVVLAFCGGYVAMLFDSRRRKATLTGPSSGGARQPPAAA
jgi:hypothetical protein